MKVNILQFRDNEKSIKYSTETTFVEIVWYNDLSARLQPWSEFERQSRYYIHFLNHKLVKGGNLLISEVK